jgi:dTMP kinase
MVAPPSRRGDWVVSDRYLLANVVYQGHAGGLDPEVIRGVGAVATGGLMPDLVVVLDVDLETAAARLARPLDKLENRGDEYRRRLREGFLTEAGRADGAITVVDARGDIATVAGRIRAAVAARLPEAG